MERDEAVEGYFMTGWAVLMAALSGQLGPEMQKLANQKLEKHCYDCITAPNPLIKLLKAKEAETGDGN